MSINVAAWQTWRRGISVASVAKMVAKSGGGIEGNRRQRHQHQRGKYVLC